MGLNLTQKLIRDHLVAGEMRPGEEIAIGIEQTLTQDATGTLVMLELEAMQLSRVKTELSAQYVDHNLIQEDHRNPDDHLFLQSACDRFGIWYSRPGNGVSHPVHMQKFGKPGKTLLGADSHTPAAGALGMLAIGAGGMEVAMAMAGHPFFLQMPRVMGIKLTGKLPDWVSAKDVILEMLRRHGVKGGVGYILEYYGPGLRGLSAMDRHVIANMGAELGATSSVFPADDAVAAFLKENDRLADFRALSADPDCRYDALDSIALSSLEPLIAKPSSPGNVVPVADIAGEDIYQAYIGSSANPGFRDLAIAAQIVKGRRVHPRVSFDINPASRDTLQQLIAGGHLAALVAAGARIHQAGCNGCIGMGQAPASGRNSLRTTPRNFPGRSGTLEDSVFLCSPETAAASALTGKITDPRTLGVKYPKLRRAQKLLLELDVLLAPPASAEGLALVKGPNIQSLPELGPLADGFEAPVLLKVGDDISTDAILPAGAKVLPYRSNIARIADFVYGQLDADYVKRAFEVKERTGHIIVGGENYGQGSSREHAALAPRYLGLRVVIAKSFARIHWQNLVNFGILPLTFLRVGDADRLHQGDRVNFSRIHAAISEGKEICVSVNGEPLTLGHQLSGRQAEILLAGGLINWVRGKQGTEKH
ncbi:aconitate hydratase [Shewanella salipaludis]|uniref:Aconitate hydratase n=1 Tax=Shewanella salipaludis TaxID=2723052 RepID=A0A972G2S8_9GAMM|nr:aconitate hydratase [Shewanella salipaludis]NMH66451.1 aconitate hydratase [Shewanella salipaludis]